MSNNYELDIIDKETAIKIATAFFNEVRSVKNAMEVIKQFGENSKKYSEVMNYSPAYYFVVYNALISEVMMIISKIYDDSKNSVNLGNFISTCQRNIELFPKEKVHTYPPENVGSGDGSINTLSEEERTFHFDLKTEEKIVGYMKKFKSMKKPLKNLKIQRNKLYAHHDLNVILKIDDIIKSNPLNMKEIELMIDLALDFSQFVIASLTTKYTLPLYSNINDWSLTLFMAEYGRKKHEEELQAKLEDEKHE